MRRVAVVVLIVLQCVLILVGVHLVVSHQSTWGTYASIIGNAIFMSLNFQTLRNLRS
jgi:fumarate reductase subunit C